MTEGTLDRVGDRWRIRFRRTLAHPPERVWRAITSSEDMTAWFPQRVSGEWQVGARLRFADPTGGLSFTGEVLRCEEPRLLEYTWGPDVLRFEIEPTGDGCTLILADSFADPGRAARDAAGWHVCLDALSGALAGGGRGIAWEPAVFDRYADAFGPEASTEKPPGQAIAVGPGSST